MQVTSVKLKEMSFHVFEGICVQKFARYASPVFFLPPTCTCFACLFLRRNPTYTYAHIKELPDHVYDVLLYRWRSRETFLDFECPLEDRLLLYINKYGEFSSTKYPSSELRSARLDDSSVRLFRQNAPPREETYRVSLTYFVTMIQINNITKEYVCTIRTIVNYLKVTVQGC
jgi:hypothetical protein